VETVVEVAVTRLNVIVMSKPEKRASRRFRNAMVTLGTLFIFLSMTAALTASSEDQMNLGTIITIAQTKHYVIIAADSRAGDTDDGVIIKSTDDNACKIVALGSNTAFAAAGLIGNKAKNWSAVSEAATASAATISGSVPIDSAQGDSILKRWAESMIQRVADFSPQQLNSYASANEGHLVTGVLAGVEKDGTTWLHAVMVNFDALTGLSYQGYTLTSNDPPTAYYFLGKSAVSLEFSDDKTSERALAERAQWQKMKLTGVEFDRFKTRRLVELTVLYHANKGEVGGAVDQIEVSAAGLRWIQVKANCQGSIPVAPASRSKRKRHK
jgi:hypothetical protein